MPKKGRPRFGSMGVWPRKRAKRPYARIRSKPSSKEAKPLAFPAYKAGMTHIIVRSKDNTPKKADINVSMPVTILECPPIRIAGVRLYKKKGTGIVVDKQLNFKTEKHLARKTLQSKDKEKQAKPEDLDKLNPDDYEDITIQIYTNPKLIDLKKTPELFEVSLGGSNKEKIEYIKNHHDKNILVTDLFKEGQVVDTHAITKGYGTQGPVRRFGIGLKNHKSEKGRRRPGTLGGWIAQAHYMYRVAYAGQTGYHQRTQYNNPLIKISDKPEEVNPKGGFVRYGTVKTSYVMVKGSIQGPKKRLVTLTQPIRPPEKQKKVFTSDSIRYISKESKQGK